MLGGTGAGEGGQGWREVRVDPESGHSKDSGFPTALTL